MLYLLFYFTVISFHKASTIYSYLNVILFIFCILSFGKDTMREKVIEIERIEIERIEIERI